MEAVEAEGEVGELIGLDDGVLGGECKFAEGFLEGYGFGL